MRGTPEREIAKNIEVPCRGERIVFWGPNTNTNSIRPKKNTEYEYEYYSSIFFTEYEYE